MEVTKIMPIFALGNKSIKQNNMRKKKETKVKEPIRIRFKKLENGNQSIYLDYYKDGLRSYEFLKLYLIPEIDDAAKVRNKNTLQIANAIKAQRLIDAINEGAGLSKANQRAKMLLSDWMQIYKEHKKKTSRGKALANQIDKTCNYLIDYKGNNITMKQVDKEFCRGFLDFLKGARKKNGNPLSGNTTHSYYSVFNHALNMAVREDVIRYNPFDKIDAAYKIQRPESEREYLTIEEVKKLIKTDCKKPELKKAFLFCCFCGLRISDVDAMTWGNLQKDGERVMLRIVVKKTNEPLTLPLSNAATKWLPERKSQKKTDKVFCLSGIVGNYYNVLLKEWAKKAGITKHVTFHVARHTFATLELTAGADLYTTSKLLGHSNITTTQIYAKIVDKKKAEAVNLVSNLFDE